MLLELWRGSVARVGSLILSQPHIAEGTLVGWVGGGDRRALRARLSLGSLRDRKPSAQAQAIKWHTKPGHVYY